MKRSTFYLITLFCLSSILPLKAAEAESLKILKKNYRELSIPSLKNPTNLVRELIQIAPETEISDQNVEELHQRYPFDLNKIEAYLKQINPDGSWQDIDYNDTKRSGWEPKLHATRILELTKLYYSADTDYFKSEDILKTIHLTLQFWFKTEPTCLNWWYNQIGIPKTLGVAFLLLEDELTAEEKQGAIRVMNNAKFGMTGQNKVWLAGNVLMGALLQNNQQMVKAARDSILSEISLGGKEGIKPDWSFHQHGAMQQFGNYGLSFISEMGFYYRLFENTCYALDETQTRIVKTFVNEGYQWIIWNRMMDISALGRQFFHNAQLHKAYTLAFSAENLGIKNIALNSNQLIGHKHFSNSDYTIHRSENWMASLKMSSNRVIGTEQVNEDNLKGYYMGDGATFYYTDGKDYLNIFPLWDWRKIPGTTTYEDTADIPNINKTKAHNKTDNVGGISFNNVGLSAMEVNREGLKARKVWFFTDDYVFCLGQGIHSDSSLMVTTAVDQRLKRGEDLQVLNNKEWDIVNGKIDLNNKETRLIHGQVGYLIRKAKGIAQTETRKGFWCEIMKMYKPKEVAGDVVSIYINHDIAPQNGTYEYFVFPSTDKNTLKSFDCKKELTLIQNNDSALILQTKKNKTGYWVIAYNCKPITIVNKTFRPERSGLFYLEEKQNELKQIVFSPFEASSSTNKNKKGR